MRAIRDHDDLRDVHTAGVGLVHNPDGQVLHAAGCAHVAAMGPRGKLHFADLAEASAHLSSDARRRWSRCPLCMPTDAPPTRYPRGPAPSVAAGAPATVAATPIPGGFELLVDRHVPFEPRTAQQRATRDLLRAGLRGLKARGGQLLHARLAGTLPQGTDIENALLYNIDQGGGCMAAATTAGLRFEVDPEPLAHGVRYRYGLAPADGAFESWRLGRELARIGHCPIDVRTLRCTPAWWALRRGAAEVATERLRPDERFCVVLDVAGPSDALRPETLKVLVDAVVCSLQAHRDTSTLDEIARRLGVALDAEPAAVADALQDTARAVLGPRPRLLHPWGTVVQWRPDDHLCVAGDVRFRTATDGGSVASSAPSSGATSQHDDVDAAPHRAGDGLSAVARPRRACHHCLRAARRLVGPPSGHCGGGRVPSAGRIVDEGGWRGLGAVASDAVSAKGPSVDARRQITTA